MGVKPLGGPKERPVFGQLIKPTRRTAPVTAHEVQTPLTGFEHLTPQLVSEPETNSETSSTPAEPVDARPNDIKEWDALLPPGGKTRALGSGKSKTTKPV